MKLTETQIETEETVVSCLIQDPHDALDLVGGRLKTELFFQPRCRHAYDAVRILDEAGTPIDLLSVVQQMQAANSLELAGGPIAIAEIFRKSPTLAHLAHHVGELEETYRKENLSRIQHKVSVALEQKEPVDDILAALHDELEALQDGAPEQMWTPANDALHEVVSWLEELQASGGKQMGFPTGFEYFDKLTGGLQPGRLYVIAGRPGAGKSTWLSNVVEDLTMESSIPTGLITLEMQTKEAMTRLLVQRMRQGEQVLTSGKMPSQTLVSLMRYAGEMSQAPLFISDKPRLSISRLRPECRRLKRQCDVKVIAVDYIQLLDASDRKQEKRHQIGEITRNLKQMSMEFGVAVIAAAQLNRESEQGEPQLRHLAESGNIEQDADVVIMLQKLKDNGVVLHVRKNRSGPTGSIKMDFAGEIFRFNEIEPIQ